MPANLNDIERKILDYMVSYLRTNTYQPSIREIGEEFGIKSTKTVSEHLQALAEKGFLERDPSRSRGVRILGVDLNARAVSVPCYREVPRERAGVRSAPPETHLSLDRRLAGAKGAFLVRAADEELGPLGIVEGDFVLIEPTEPEEVPEGAVVLAGTGERPGYHRLSRNGRGVLLSPVGGNGSPITVEEPDRLQILGRVTAFYRRIDGGGALFAHPTAH